MKALVRMRYSQARRLVPSVNPPKPAVGPQVGLLDEVLGVGLVARHAQGGRVQLRRVLHRLVGERRGVGHADGRYPAAPSATRRRGRRRTRRPTRGSARAGRRAGRGRRRRTVAKTASMSAARRAATTAWSRRPSSVSWTVTTRPSSRVGCTPGEPGGLHPLQRARDGRRVDAQGTPGRTSAGRRRHAAGRARRGGPGRRSRARRGGPKSSSRRTSVDGPRRSSRHARPIRDCGRRRCPDSAANGIAPRTSGASAIAGVHSRSGLVSSCSSGAASCGRR